MNQEERLLLSRKKIIDAAMNEFGKKGYAGASTNCICKESSISKGLLFYYFKTKEKLFCACATRAISEFDAYMWQNFQMAGEPLSEIKICCELRKKFFSNNPAYQSILSEVLFGSLCLEGDIQQLIGLRYRNHTYRMIKNILENVDLIQTIKRDDVINTVINLMDYIDLKIWKEHFLNDNVADIVDKQMKDYETYLEIILYGIVKRNHVDT